MTIRIALLAAILGLAACHLPPEPTVDYAPTIEAVGEAISTTSAFLPPPWNWLAGVIAAGVTAGGAALGHGKGKIKSYNKGRKDEAKAK
jgi:hypothetical protein